MQLFPVEIKSGRTIAQDYFKGLNYWNTLTKSNQEASFVVYAGNENQKRAGELVVSWKAASVLIHAL